MALDPSMPREKVNCPYCGFDEAVFYMKPDKEEKKIVI